MTSERDTRTDDEWVTEKTTEAITWLNYNGYDTPDEGE
jgi:hypothetical protein